LRADVATVFVVIALGALLAVMAYVRMSDRPRHAMPSELSRLGPPFNPQGNGVRKCST
jgi:hypothetical protein